MWYKSNISFFADYSVQLLLLDVSWYCVTMASTLSCDDSMPGFNNCFYLTCLTGDISCMITVKTNAIYQWLSESGIK